MSEAYKEHKLVAVDSLKWHGTTILAVRHRDKIAMGGDGQVTLSEAVIMKSRARKVYRLAKGRVIAGFAGATADAFTLLERFEKRLDSNNHRLSRAAQELARDWRTDRVLRRLEAMLIIADVNELLVVSGMGDVLEPEEGVAAIGSGAIYARSSALALIRHAPELSAKEMVLSSLQVAADSCVYTNHEFTVESLE